MKHLLTFLFITVALFLSGRSTSMAQTTLSSGDIVLLAFNGDDTDGFSFMPLVDLAIGTKINFTDYGWNGTSFNTSEESGSAGGNMITYTAPSAITAGTIIRQDKLNVGGSAFTACSDWSYNNGGYNYINAFIQTSAGHDGIIAFQGLPTAPTFLWAMQTGSWGGTDNYWNSALPTGLTNGTNAIYFPDLTTVAPGNPGTDLTVDDGQYTGPTTAATAFEWRTRVATLGNWTSVTDNKPAVSYPTGSYPVITAITNAASNIIATGTTLNGSINAQSSSVTVIFEYGTTTSYGTTVTAIESPVSGSSATTVSKAISGLTAGTLYHYRVKGSNAGGVTYGSDLTFTTSAAAAAPTVSGISPTSGSTAGGLLVVITGTNLSAASAVKFGATNASSYTVNSATQITATSPAGSAGTVDVTVTTAGGTSATGSSDRFTYVAVPTVTGISPTSGSTAGGTTVVITGTNLTGATSVMFGSNAATGVTVNSATQITATSPSGTAATIHITVTTPGGTSATSASDQFTYIAPPTATTNTVTSVTATVATLNGSINANSASTTVTFEYGLTTSYGTTVTAVQSPITGSSATSVSKTITGLTPNTTYHFRVIGVNAEGTTYGLDVSFTTPSPNKLSADATPFCTQSTTTFPASINAGPAEVGPDYGCLARIGDHPNPSWFYFKILTGGNLQITTTNSLNRDVDFVLWGPFSGPTSGSSLSTGTIVVCGPSSGATEVIDISSCSAGEYYMLLITNFSNTATDISLTKTGGTAETDCGITVIPLPTATTNAATSVTSSGATLNGSINTNNNSTTVTFEYGLTTGYGTSVTADQSPVRGSTATSVSKAITGLTGSTTYHYRVVGSNAGGTTNGDDQTFTTLPPVEVTATSGTVGPNNYASLKAAFDKINDGTHKGAITIKINASTTETVSAVLNASNSPSNYTSVNIYPTVTGLSISGNLAAPLIDLNGADNVTIDGRVNATGSAKDLIITNTSTSSTAGTSTIRFINDASTNIVKYCNIKGSETNSSAGILFFSTTTGTTGNDGNTIDNNNITNSADVNRPLNAVYSLGTSAKENSSNTISNNNIYDFLNRGIESYGIKLMGYTTSCTISGNSFYETNSFVPIGETSHYLIYIDNTTGTDFSISNNYIGGSSPNCGTGGSVTSWTKTEAQNNSFYGIYLNIGTGTVTSIQGNTMKNISYSSSGFSSWAGIFSLGGGDLNIGTISGNTIGESIGNGSITFTGGSTNSNFYGFYIQNTGTVNIQNNAIGSIQASNASSTNSTNFIGIYKSNPGTTTISNNTIGSITTANSIHASSESSANAQNVYGIYSAGTGVVTISGNTVAKMTNGTTNTTGGTAGAINGIKATAGTNTIQNNSIHDLTIANANNSATNTASVIGINHTSTDVGLTISGNTIYNLSNTYTSFAGNVIGLYFNGPTSGTNSVSKNFIHSLSATSTSTSVALYGLKLDGGTATYSNNIISLGTGITNGNAIYGIKNASSVTTNLYYNTVDIEGAVTGETSNTYALSNGAYSRNYRNNIFNNSRSGGTTGKHYAVSVSSAASLTMDYNDYYAPNGVLGNLGGDKTTLTEWLSATGQDTHSLNTIPNFAIAGGTTAANYLPSATSLVAVTGTGITTDYAGTTRSASYPSMGAYEYALAPNVTSVSVPTNSTYKTGDNLDFTVNYNQTVTVNGTPPSISVTLNTGGTVNASYLSGSGSTAIVFRYTVVNGNYDNDGISVGSSIALNGGTITNVSDQNASLILNNVASTTGVLVEAIAPTVTSVNSSTADGTYKSGDAISIQVNFSEAVTITGTPQLTLETGTTDRVINCASGSGTSVLTFTYTVQAGDLSSDLDYQSTTSLALNGGTIKDAVGNNATLTLVTPGAANSLGSNKAIVIAMAPLVTSGDATSVTSTGVTLNGSVTAQNASTVVTFKYGTTASYGNVVTANQSPVTGSTGTAVSYTLSGLVPNKTYHYRTVGQNVVGTTNGDYKSFTTTAAASSIFTGTGNWSDSARWSAGIPGTISATTIEGTCTVEGDYEVASMAITSGSVSINPGKVLKVTGAVTNSVGTTGLILKSNSTGTGNLVNNSTGVRATINQYFAKDQWHYYTLPITTNIDVCPLFYRFWAIGYNEDVRDWTYLNAGDMLIPGIGYGAQYKSVSNNDTTVAITGILNSGDFIVNAAFTGDGWKMIGNPYPCTVDWSSGITLNNVGNAIYLWNPVTDNYGYYVNGVSTNGQTQYIAPMQGFFVRPTAASGSVTITNAAKSTAPSMFRDAVIQSIIRLEVVDPNYRADESVIRIKADATNLFDTEMDAYKLNSWTTLAPQLYSEVNGIEYSINSIPEANDRTLIPIRLMAKQSGIHRISLTELKDYDIGLPIYLYTSDMKEYVNLQQGDYSFKAEAGKIVELMMAFTNTPTNADIMGLNSIYVLVKDKIINVREMNGRRNDVIIINMSGKVVYRNTVESRNIEVPVSFDGVYIVKVIPEQGNVYIGKVVVK